MIDDEKFVVKTPGDEKLTSVKEEDGNNTISEHDEESEEEYEDEMEEEVRRSHAS